MGDVQAGNPEDEVLVEGIWHTMCIEWSSTEVAGTRVRLVRAGIDEPHC